MPRPFITGYQGYFNPGQSVPIAQGAQISSAFNCGGMVVAGIVMPNVFTGTALTFLMGDSIDGYAADGQIIFDTNPANLDTLTLNGVVITFVTGTPSGSQVQIGGSATLTMAALQAFLNATVDASLLALTYASSGTAMVVAAVAHGVAGNAIVFDKSSSHMTLTPSGGVLSGGGFRPLYDASNALVSMTVAQGRAYAVDPKNFQGVQFLQIKSGSAELAPRTLICTLKGF